MIKRSVNLLLGVLLVIFGLSMMPLPIPIGLIMIVLGLSLLVSALPSLRRLLTQLRRRFPATSSWLADIQCYLPSFARRLLDQTDPNQPDSD